MPPIKGPIKRPAFRKPKQPITNKFVNAKKPDNSVQINKSLRQSLGDLSKSLAQNNSLSKKKKTVTSEQQRKRAIRLAKQR